MITAVNEGMITFFNTIEARGSDALKNDSVIKRVTGDADKRAWENITDILESLGFTLDELGKKKEWQKTLNSKGLLEGLPASANLQDAEEWILRFVSLDGEYTIAKMPGRGDVTLSSRVLHYRLKYFGLFDGPVGSPYGVSDSCWEETLRNWFFTDSLPKSTLDFANLLGNIHALWDLLIDSAGALPVLIVKGPGDMGIEEESLESAAASWNFNGPGAGFSDYYHDREDVYKLDKYTDSARNNFGLRLLRIVLWMDGFCESFASAGEYFDIAAVLLRLLEGEGERERIIRRVGNGVWAVNIIAFKHYFVVNNEYENTSQAETVVKDMIFGDKQNEDDSSFLLRLNSVLEQKAVKKSKKKKNSVIRFFKRFYRGIKRVVKKVVDVIKKGLSWLKEHIVKPVGAFISKTIARIIRGWDYFKTKIIRPARDFFKGFILSKSASAGGFVMTKLNFDADMSVFIYTEERELLEKHGQRLIGLSRHLQRFMLLLGKVIKLVMNLMSGPIGWAKAAFTIGSMVLDYVKNQDPDFGV